MAEKNKGNPGQKGSPGVQQQKPVKDLDAKDDDMKSVKGGRRVYSSDPQEGGQ